MTGETDNSLSGETDNAHPLEADNSDFLDYYDPDEDNVEIEAEEETDDEEQAETDTEEQSEVDDEAEEEADDEQAETPALVTLSNGEQVTHDELVNGYQRQADYTRKMQDVSNQRGTVRADAERMERIIDVFTEHLSSLVPPEPPTSLSLSNPGEFTAQKAQYDAAVAQVQKLVALAGEPKAITSKIDQGELQKSAAEELRMLNEALPQTATREGQEKFWGETVKSAGEFGFTPDELSAVTDHRLLLLAHWAGRGKAAEQAKSKAQAKAQKAAPATPRKPGQPARQANRNAEAMRKLSKSGSMTDALAIDFD